VERIRNVGVERHMSDHRDNPKQQPVGNAEKDPDDWVTGDEPMTGAQASYLQKLSEEAGQEAPHDLTKSEPSKKVDELQEQTGPIN
jgi:hypothetical protein